MRAALASPEALCADYERRAAEQHGRAGRRSQGLFYTPPEIAAQVVALALAHGPKLGERPRVLDACAGAGVFLLAAARALPQARLAGTDLDGAALAVAGEALALLGRRAALETLDALDQTPPGGPVDLLVGNPPYGHAPPGAREGLLARFPALRGAEIDLYAAFLLRSVELLRPGGCAALLVPDTWMTNARGAALRAEVLAVAELRAVADLGKPFAAAKDTRVQAVVLVRRQERSRPGTHQVQTARLVAGILQALASLDEGELLLRNQAGWQPYRSEGEKRLCAALEAASLPLAEVCEVGYGLRTGNNGLHVGRGPGPGGAIPLCGGEDVVPFGLKLEQKPKHLASPTDGLLRLAARQQGRPRVAVQRIRTNAAAPWARWLEAAPVPAEVVCLDSITTLFAPPGAPLLLPGLVGLCGSVAWNRWHRLRTTDVNVKPSSLRALPLPRALLEPEKQRAFARLVRERVAEVEATAPPLRAGRPPAEPAPALERALDRAVYGLFGLGEREVEEAERGFWGERFDLEFERLPTPR